VNIILPIFWRHSTRSRWRPAALQIRRSLAPANCAEHQDNPGFASHVARACAGKIAVRNLAYI
jgi:hypothetical protein